MRSSRFSSTTWGREKYAIVESHGRLQKLPQTVQKGHWSHPPSPGVPRHASPQARPQQVNKDDPSKLARACCPRDGSDESPTARVQRGPSEAARCASTGDSPGHPPLLAAFFNSLLHIHHTLRYPATLLIPLHRQLGVGRAFHFNSRLMSRHLDRLSPCRRVQCMVVEAHVESAE